MRVIRIVAYASEEDVEFWDESPDEDDFVKDLSTQISRENCLKILSEKHGLDTSVPPSFIPASSYPEDRRSEYTVFGYKIDLWIGSEGNPFLAFFDTNHYATYAPFRERYPMIPWWQSVIHLHPRAENCLPKGMVTIFEYLVKHLPEYEKRTTPRGVALL